MRLIMIIFALCAPAAAWADPGHLAEIAGHSHWLAGAALGAAAALGWLAWGQKGKEEAEAEGETPEEAPA